MSLAPLASAALASAVAIVIIIGFAIRPRLRRSTSAHQDRRSFAAQLERFIGDIRQTRNRNRPAPPEDVAEWCDQLARRMRSGSTLRGALMATIPSGVALRHTTDGLRLALERGQPVTNALASTRPSHPTQLYGDPTRRNGDPTRRYGDPHSALAFAIISIAARLGGANATALDRAAGSLRLRAADQHERKSQAAQARLSAHVLTVVPLAMLALLVLIDEDVRATLQTPIGASCVVFGLALNAAGWKWMRHIIGVRQ